MLDLSNKSENNCIYSSRVSDAVCCLSIKFDTAYCFVTTDPKIEVQTFFDLVPAHGVWK